MKRVERRVQVRRRENMSFVEVIGNNKKELGRELVESRH
jgi:hypothetical protein